jgi:hypothetical protein
LEYSDFLGALGGLPFDGTILREPSSDQKSFYDVAIRPNGYIMLPFSREESAFVSVS